MKWNIGFPVLLIDFAYHHVGSGWVKIPDLMYLYTTVLRRFDMKLVKTPYARVDDLHSRLILVSISLRPSVYEKRKWPSTNTVSPKKRATLS